MRVQVWVLIWLWFRLSSRFRNRVWVIVRIRIRVTVRFRYRVSITFRKNHDKSLDWGYYEAQS